MRNPVGIASSMSNDSFLKNLCDYFRVNGIYRPVNDFMKGDRYKPRVQNHEFLSRGEDYICKITIEDLKASEKVMRKHRKKRKNKRQCANAV